MRRLVLGVACGAVVVIAVVLVVAATALDSVVKRNVETNGTALTGTAVRVGDVSAALLSGSCRLDNLEVDNPPGWSGPLAIRVARIDLQVRLLSLLAHKTHVTHVRLEAPEVWIEGTPASNNIGRILATVNGAPGSPSAPSTAAANPAAAPARRLQVDDVAVVGGKVHLDTAIAHGGSAPLALPEVHMAGLGQGPEGITADELARTVLAAVAVRTVAVLAGHLAETGGSLVKGRSGVARGAADKANEALKGIRGLFHKK